jgi:DNA invertase Pin-like site-specific DNA recombinase
MRRLVDAFAEYERLIIKARTRAALAAKKARGERRGGVPYGSRIDPEASKRSEAGRPCRLRPDPAEVEALGSIRRWKSEGASLRAISRRLDEMGVPTKGGRPWSHTTVRDLLRRSSDAEA